MALGGLPTPRRSLGPPVSWALDPATQDKVFLKSKVDSGRVGETASKTWGAPGRTGVHGDWERQLPAGLWLQACCFSAAPHRGAGSQRCPPWRDPVMNVGLVVSA